MYIAEHIASSADDARLHVNRCIGGILPSDYSLMLWLPGGTSRHGKLHFISNFMPIFKATAQRVPIVFVGIPRCLSCSGLHSAVLAGPNQRFLAKQKQRMARFHRHPPRGENQQTSGQLGAEDRQFVAEAVSQLCHRAGEKLRKSIMVYWE